MSDVTDVTRRRFQNRTPYIAPTPPLSSPYPQSLSQSPRRPPRIACAFSAALPMALHRLWRTGLKSAGDRDKRQVTPNNLFSPRLVPKLRSKDVSPPGDAHTQHYLIFRGSALHPQWPLPFFDEEVGDQQDQYSGHSLRTSLSKKELASKFHLRLALCIWDCSVSGWCLVLSLFLLLL